MQIILSQSKQQLGARAARQSAGAIRRFVDKHGEAFIVVATGASQFETLAAFVDEDVPWERVTAFHLDEYVGMSNRHPASFQRYLQERFVDKLPRPLKAFHAISGEGDPQRECERLNALIRPHPICVALVGIGENGHLAFNDPPADFEVSDPYLVVDLNDDCRAQQQGEGWFASLDEVPTQAISMSIQQILRAREIVCSVPDQRKARAVQMCLEGEVSNLAPASILQKHAGAFIYLDPPSASLLQFQKV